MFRHFNLNAEKKEGKRKENLRVEICSCFPILANKNAKTRPFENGNGI